MHFFVTIAKHCAAHIFPDPLEIRGQQKGLLFLLVSAATLQEIATHRLEKFRFALDIRLPYLVSEHPLRHFLRAGRLHLWRDCSAHAGHPPPITVYLCHKIAMDFLNHVTVDRIAGFHVRLVINGLPVRDKRYRFMYRLRP